MFVLSDIRNTKVIDMIYELQDLGLKVSVMDPLAALKIDKINIWY